MYGLLWSLFFVVCQSSCLQSWGWEEAVVRHLLGYLPNPVEGALPTFYARLLSSAHNQTWSLIYETNYGYPLRFFSNAFFLAVRCSSIAENWLQVLAIVAYSFLQIYGNLFWSWWPPLRLAYVTTHSPPYLSGRGPMFEKQQRGKGIRRRIEEQWNAGWIAMQWKLQVSRSSASKEQVTSIIISFPHHRLFLCYDLLLWWILM